MYKKGLYIRELELLEMLLEKIDHFTIYTDSVLVDGTDFSFSVTDEERRTLIDTLCDMYGSKEQNREAYYESSIVTFSDRCIY